MYTYQDFEKVINSEFAKQQFILSAIATHKSSDIYKTAWTAKEYFEKRNVTINKYEKWLYKATGEKVKDTISPNHKLSCGYFFWFVIQQNEYLLSNGVNFAKPNTKDLLGGRQFDNDLKLKGGEAALWGGVSFGFFNRDKIHYFNILEFVPLYDEETDALKAGIYFWQIDSTKPLRVTLYEIDGYTDYIFNTDDKEGVRILTPKRPYNLNVSVSEVGGMEILSGQNYPSFPIVPFWGNPEHQSEFIGMRTLIDAYDLILSGYANTVDEVSEIFWTLSNADGTDEVGAVEFKDMVKRLKVATDGATPHSIDIPVSSRESILEQLRTNMYTKFGAFDTKEIYSGNVTATAIETAYDNLDKKADRYETCVSDFINSILNLANIDDAPIYQRSIQRNKTEELDNILKAAQYLPESYITKKILTIFGDIDQYDIIMQEMTETEAARYEDDNETATEGVVDINNAIDEAEESIGKTLNGAQTQALILIIQQYANGIISRGQAIAIISRAIGVTKDEAAEIIEG